jgi:hypothetical protein
MFPLTSLVTAVSTAVLLAFIVVSLWLGLFLVTRGGRARRVWLAALTLWAVGCWFFYELLQLSLPNYGELIWLLWIGQAIKFAPTFWFQLSHQLRLDSNTLRPWQRKAGAAVIVVAYLLTIYNIWDTSRNFGVVPFPGEIPSYILFLTLLIILPLWTVVNFARVQTQMRLPLWRRQMIHLLVATVIAYAGGLYAGFVVYFRLDVPYFPAQLLLGIGIILLGYGVVKYDALLEGRSIERDALYSSVSAALITLIFALVGWALWLTGAVTLPAVAIILICTVATTTLSDGGRALIDRLFYRGYLRRLRTDLRYFAHEAGMGRTLGEQLELVLETVCQTIGVEQGFIAIRQSPDSDFEVAASRLARWRGRRFAPSTLAADAIVDLLALPPQSSPVADGRRDLGRDLAEMAMIVPLAENYFQTGALVLGNKLSGAPYRTEDLDYLESAGQQLATMMEVAWQQEGRARELESSMELYLAREKELQQKMQQLVSATNPGATPSPAAPALDGESATALTEDALQHLNDYAYLGEHPFAKLAVIHRFLPADATLSPATAAGVTHLAQAKALHALLVYAIEQLRPAGAEPAAGAVPGRQWYNYLILRDSYVKEELTREIMARLYIGEGTYNRTRRTALRSVAKTVQEMEQQSQIQQPDGARVKEAG